MTHARAPHCLLLPVSMTLALAVGCVRVDPAPVPPPPCPPGCCPCEDVTPGPKPTPDTAPVDEPGLRVLVVYESADRPSLPRGQLAILSSGRVAAWLDSHCVEEDGHPGWRLWDPDVDASHEREVWRKFLDVRRESLPWVVISDGRRGYSGPLPETVDDMLELLGAYE